jgi:integrase
VLFCDFVRDWVEMNRNKLQPSTYMNYIHLLDRHVCPHFQATGLQLKNVMPDSIQRYYNAKLGEGLNPNTVIKHHAVIRSALKYAVRSRLIKENPCDFVDKPKRKKYVGEFYNADEIKQLLAVAKGTAIEVPVFIAAYFGLRRSEVIGCRWSAIDFTNSTLTVCHKVVRAIEGGRLVNIATDDLKTESSYRVLPLSESLLEFFTNVKNRQEKNRELCGNAYNTDYLDYVCVNAMGELLNPDHVTSAFAKIIKRNSLKRIRYHDLRHSCASLLLALGYSMKEIQEWLGHSNYQTTANFYSHVDPRNKKSMIQGLSGALDASGT